MYKVELLLDHADAELLGLAWAEGVHVLAAQAYLPRVLSMHAEQDSDQGRPTGTILAYQGVDFAFPQFEVHIVQRANAQEVFGDVLHLKDKLILHSVSFT